MIRLPYQLGVCKIYDARITRLDEHILELVPEPLTVWLVHQRTSISSRKTHRIFEVA